MAVLETVRKASEERHIDFLRWHHHGVSDPDPRPLLERLERYYDAVLRRSAQVEAVGPFTLFVAAAGGPFYARPRLGLTTPINGDDVTVVLARQRTLGVPEALEWVCETTPSLADAARSAGLTVAELPLLILDRPLAVRAPVGFQVRRVMANEGDLERILAVAEVAFAHASSAQGPAGPEERDVIAATIATDRSRMRERLATGTTVLMVAEDHDGPIASGMHQLVDDVTEVVGVATLPTARRRGAATAVTAALVREALSSGASLVFLSAASDAIARIYEKLGFRRIARAGIAEVPRA